MYVRRAGIFRQKMPSLQISRPDVFCLFVPLSYFIGKQAENSSEICQGDVSKGDLSPFECCYSAGG